MLAMVAHAAAAMSVTAPAGDMASTVRSVVAMIEQLEMELAQPSSAMTNPCAEVRARIWALPWSADRVGPCSGQLHRRNRVHTL
jgi:hypothetical protein